MEKHVYFVRHGQTDSNVDHVYRGRDEVLTEEGRSQAQAVTERIERIGVEAIVTSPFQRAHETAIIIGERIGLTPEKNEFLGEWLEPSRVTGMHRDEPIRKDARFAIYGAHHDPHYRHADEETFTELTARAENAMRTLAEHPVSRICVVTHGAFLRLIIGAMTFGPDFTKKHFMDMFWNFASTNTGITYIRKTEQVPQWQLITWNDQSHLG